MQVSEQARADCPYAPHRPPQGPNEDMGVCTICFAPSHVMRPAGEPYGDHLPDCSLPRQHEGYCLPGGSGHPRATDVRGYWPARCGNAEPHHPHEWYDPAFRRDCPGVRLG